MRGAVRISMPPPLEAPSGAPSVRNRARLGNARPVRVTSSRRRSREDDLLTVEVETGRRESRSSASRSTPVGCVSLRASGSELWAQPPGTRCPSPRGAPATDCPDVFEEPGREETPGWTVCSPSDSRSRSHRNFSCPPPQIVRYPAVAIEREQRSSSARRPLQANSAAPHRRHKDCFGEFFAPSSGWIWIPQPHARMIRWISESSSTAATNGMPPANNP